MVEQNALAPLPDATHPPAVYQEQQGGLVVRWTENAIAVRTSLPVDTPAGKLAYVRCLTSQGTPLADLIGKDIYVKDWLVHEVEFPSRDSGEVVNTLRLVFLTPDGQLITTFSTVVADNWSHVARVMGAKTFDPPCKVVFARRKGSKPGAYIQLESIEFPDTIETKSRKAKANAAE